MENPISAAADDHRREDDGVPSLFSFSFFCGAGDSSSEGKKPRSHLPGAARDEVTERSKCSLALATWVRARL